MTRPASEHAREEALEVAATALSLHTSWSKAEMAWALQTLASALAVVEQERDQLREALKGMAYLRARGVGLSLTPRCV